MFELWNVYYYSTSTNQLYVVVAYMLLTFPWRCPVDLPIHEKCVHARISISSNSVLLKSVINTKA